MSLDSSPLLRNALVALAAALIAVVLVTAGTQKRPGPRLSRRDRLVDLIRAQDSRARTLRDELDGLRRSLATLEAQGATRTRSVSDLRQVAEGLAPFAGLAAVKGPGLTVELRDSSQRTSPSGDPNDLVIHQQDIQAVVNALWEGGAEAIAINGERVTSTSAIRCVGNTLLLHGNVYSPPYRVGAIGDQRAMHEALDSDLLVERFRSAVRQFRLGFDVREADRMSLPAFRGVTPSRYAEIA